MTQEGQETGQVPACTQVVPAPGGLSGSTMLWIQPANHSHCLSSAGELGRGVLSRALSLQVSAQRPSLWSPLSSSSPAGTQRTFPAAWLEPATADPSSWVLLSTTGLHRPQPRTPDTPLGDRSHFPQTLPMAPFPSTQTTARVSLHSPSVGRCPAECV